MRLVEKCSGGKSGDYNIGWGGNGARIFEIGFGQTRTVPGAFPEAEREGRLGCGWGTASRGRGSR